MPKRIIVPPTSANGRNGSGVKIPIAINKQDELQKEIEMIQGEDEQLQQVEDSFGVFTDKYPIEARLLFLSLFDFYYECLRG
jgi:hypothetical protein